MKTIYTNNFVIMLIVILTGALTGCSDDISKNEIIDGPLNIELTRSEAIISDGFNEFAFDLFRAINANTKKFDENHPVILNDGENTESDLEGSENTKYNYLVSPLGIAWNCSMMSNAVSDQEALDEIMKMLHQEEGATPDDINGYCLKLTEAFSQAKARSQFKMNNAFFYKDFIKIFPEFISILNENYSPEIFVNPTNEVFDRWIASSTDGLIQGFAERYNFRRDDFGVLNNICFSGLWAEPFDKENTALESFKNIDGTMGAVNMMSKILSYQISGDDNCWLMKVFFQGGAFAINFLIPSEEQNLENVINSMNKDKWEYLMSSLRGEKGFVKIPRFDMKNDLDVLDVMRGLGVNKIFDYPYALEKMAVIDEGACITRVQQSVKASVDEKGVKAAASSIMSGLIGSYMPSETFFLDESFCYVLTEESTGAILLMGKVGKL